MYYFSSGFYYVREIMDLKNQIDAFNFSLF